MRALFVLLLATTSMACVGPGLRPVEMAPSRPAEAPMPAVPSKPHAYVAPTDCGDALIEHALVLHHGEGENHPARVVLEAKLATCPQPVSPSPARCFAIAKERTERSRDWGPRHPAMIDLALAATLCKDVPPPPPLPPVACEEARRRRDALIAAGKGANHPLLVAAESAVADCVR